MKLTEKAAVNNVPSQVRNCAVPLDRLGSEISFSRSRQIQNFMWKIINIFFRSRTLLSMSHFSARFGNKPVKSYISIRADDAYFADEIYTL